MKSLGVEKKAYPPTPVIAAVVDVELALPFLCHSEEEIKAFTAAVELIGHEAWVLRKGGSDGL